MVASHHGTARRATGRAWMRESAAVRLGLPPLSVLSGPLTRLMAMRCDTYAAVAKTAPWCGSDLRSQLQDTSRWPINFLQRLDRRRTSLERTAKLPQSTCPLRPSF